VFVVLLVAVAGLVVGGAAVMATQAPPSGDEIVENVETAYANAETVTGAATVTVSNESTTETAEVEFAAADERARVVVTRDGDTAMVGTNGTVAWAYDPATGALQVWNESDRDRLLDQYDVPDGEQAWNGSVAWNDSAYTATREATETLNGTETTRVRLEPTNESLDMSATIWVDTEDWTVLRQRVTDGTNATRVDYRDVRFNASVHESTFEPPTGDASVVTGYGVTSYDGFAAAQANTSVDLPVLNASAYTFQRAAVTTVGEETTVAQTYANDSERVLLVATTGTDLPDVDENATRVTVDGVNATLTTVRGQTAVWWQRDGLTYAVVADADAERVRALAEAVEDA
jgi:outer membrane lipoprotein-sorting protein